MIGPRSDSLLLLMSVEYSARYLIFVFSSLFFYFFMVVPTYLKSTNNVSTLFSLYVLLPFSFPNSPRWPLHPLSTTWTSRNTSSGTLWPFNILRVRILTAFKEMQGAETRAMLFKHFWCPPAFPSRLGQEPISYLSKVWHFILLVILSQVNCTIYGTQRSSVTRRLSRALSGIG